MARSSEIRKYGKHGMWRTPEYDAYSNAKARCNKPSHKAYANYGGRGIQFRFKNFEEFFAELGPRPDGMSLDRIDNDGHYEVGNVKWSTRSEQAYNRRSRSEYVQNQL